MLRILIVLQVFLNVINSERRFIVAPRYSLCDNSTWNEAGSIVPFQAGRCRGLQEMLQVINSNIAPDDDVIVSIEGSNDYFLDTPIYLLMPNGSVPNVSLMLEGMKSSPDGAKPRIMCNFTHSSLTDVLPYTLRFSYFSSIVIEGLEIVSCPRSIAVVDTLNITITNSLFRYISTYL